MTTRFSKKIAAGLLASAVAVTLAACSGDSDGGNSGSGDGGTVSLRLTQTNPATSDVGIASEEFAEMINERTDGRYEVTVYHDGQLGDERGSVEAVQLGNIDIAMVNTSVLVNFAPELKVFDLPYVIRSTEHADEVFLGDVGDQALGWVDAIGVKAIGVWESGFRNLTNSVRPVESVDDVSGLRIRVMENDIHQQLWLALGADPVPMAWGEAYTALQQGALDGQENPNTVILTNNVQEVNNNLAITQHIYSTVIPIMSQSAWDALSEEDQLIFEEVFDEMEIREREIARESDGEALAELEAQGMQVTYPDKEGFIEKTQSVRDDNASEYQGILDQIEELAE